MKKKEELIPIVINTTASVRRDLMELAEEKIQNLVNDTAELLLDTQDGWGTESVEFSEKETSLVVSYLEQALDYAKILHGLAALREEQDETTEEDTDPPETDSGRTCKNDCACSGS